MLLTPSDANVHSSLSQAGQSLTLEGLARAGGTPEGVIEGIEGEPAQRRRLLEAGFTTGCVVRFTMATPFGDPLVFALRGASIALRKSEARCVRVSLRPAS